MARPIATQETPDFAVMPRSFTSLTAAMTGMRCDSSVMRGVRPSKDTVPMTSASAAAAHWAIGDAMAAVDKDVRKRLGAFTLDRLQRQRHG